MRHLNKKLATTYHFVLSVAIFVIFGIVFLLVLVLLVLVLLLHLLLFLLLAVLCDIEAKRTRKRREQTVMSKERTFGRRHRRRSSGAGRTATNVVDDRANSVFRNDQEFGYLVVGSGGGASSFTAAAAAAVVAA